MALLREKHEFRKADDAIHDGTLTNVIAELDLKK